MRILAAIVIGVALAFAASAGLVTAAQPTPDPVTQPLYNYGGR
jgi:hypothetical protein